MIANYVMKRDGIWHFRRRVPADLADIDSRGSVRKSLKTRDYAKAIILATRINAELEAYWSSIAETGALSPADTAAALDKFERSVRLARTLGVAYRPADEVLSGNLHELTRRLVALETRVTGPTGPAADAVLGTAPSPSLCLSGMYEAYARYARDQLKGKSEDQKRKWKNPRTKAVRNMIALVGDKALGEISRNDALDFREWWIDRVEEEDYDPGSANKDIGYLDTMFRRLDMALRLNLLSPFQGLRVAGERHNPRVPYDPAFVRSHILPDTRLSSLNDDARAIVLMVATTGARPSEIAALTASRICLTHNIPHIVIAAEARQLKTHHSARQIPLVGKALEAMRSFPNGFDRYRDTPDTFSATANKALGAAGLRPTTEHTVYSLRHTFKDRLIKIEAPERVQDALMGHRVREVEYGAGPDLEQLRDWISRVWA